MDLFETNHSHGPEVAKNRTTIYVTSGIHQDLRSSLDNEFQLVLLDKQLFQDPQDLCLIDQSFLSIHEFSFIEAFSMPIIFIGEYRPALPSNCFYLSSVNKGEVREVLSFFENFSTKKTIAYKNLKKDRDFFIQHVFNFCVNNSKLNLDDRRWLQEALIIVHAELLLAGSLVELSDIIHRLSSHLKPNIQKLSFKLCEGDHLREDHIFRFGIYVKNDLYSLEGHFSKHDFAASILFYILTKTTELVISFHQRTESISERWHLLHTLVQEMPFPFILINPDGELIFHNKDFDQLEVLPKDCLRFQDGEIATLSSQLFTVSKRLIELEGDSHYLMTFFKQKVEEKKEQPTSSSEELGIISSSIAHELNNPVAGILAASTLLELDEDLEPQDLSKLAEIKSSARRIKQLVDIFLGFSRGRIGESRQVTLQDCLSRAFDLLRFRMAEMNANLDFEYRNFSQYQRRKVNESIYSMVLYLVCSEILTIYSHKKLIENKVQRLEKLIVEEDERYFSLSTLDSKKLFDKISEQKLCLHLLKLEGLKLSYQDQKLFFFFPLES